MGVFHGDAAYHHALCRVAGNGRARDQRGVHMECTDYADRSTCVRVLVQRALLADSCVRSKVVPVGDCCWRCSGVGYPQQVGCRTQCLGHCRCGGRSGRAAGISKNGLCAIDGILSRTQYVGLHRRVPARLSVSS